MIFICVMNYKGQEEVQVVRPLHRRYMQKLIEQGQVIAAGSFPPDHDGGLFMYAVSSREEAEKLVKEDPYITNNVAKVLFLREYEVHGANAALLRAGG